MRSMRKREVVCGSAIETSQHVTDLLGGSSVRHCCGLGVRCASEWMRAQSGQSLPLGFRARRYCEAARGGLCGEGVREMR
jgi:hypothetical protein